MGNLRAGGRIAALTAITLIGAPLQWLALRLGWRQARRTLPVLFHRLVCRIIGVRVRVSGAPPDGMGTLLVSNHMSWVDIAAISSVTPVSFIAKSEVAGWPVFGTFARLQRSVFIDRSRRSATAEVNSLIAKRLGDGDSIVLFAEGTTGEGLRVLPFRSALVGAATGPANGQTIRLQPMSICYLRRGGMPLGRRTLPLVAWYGDMELAPHLLALLRSPQRYEAVITFGDPVEAATIARKAATRHAEEFARSSIRALRRSPL